MSTTWKVVLGILVILGVVWGFKYMGNPKTGSMQDSSKSSSVATDASLDADLGKIDAQLGDVSSESAQVDSSMNDKPVEQSE